MPEHVDEVGNADIDRGAFHLRSTETPRPIEDKLGVLSSSASTSSWPEPASRASHTVAAYCSS